MAKTSYILIPPGYEEILNRGLRPGDRFTICRVARKIRFLSVPKKRKISQRSLLPQIGEAWNALSLVEQQAWNDAGAVMNLSGWKLFVQDKCLRIQLELPGNATPSLLHQSWVGVAHIEAPATGLVLEQPHPKFYWVKRKVTGTKSQYTLRQITEAFSLPMTLQLNYKSSLIDVSGTGYARLRARVRSLYQGRNIYTDCVANMLFSSDWTTATGALAGVKGKAIAYTLFLELEGVEGDIWFDDVIVFHSGQSWTRDPYCRAIRSSFTGAYFQVPRNWAPIELPDGADYDSLYFDA